MEQYYLHDLKQQREPGSPYRLHTARSDEVRITEEEEELPKLSSNKTNSMANLHFYLQERPAIGIGALYASCGITVQL